MDDVKTRLVILDDENHIIRLLQALIPWRELEISYEGCAGNGADGKALILEKKPDIVITDIKMPGTDGLSLIADVHETLPETDFIIVSGFSQFDYARKAIVYNVENYLLKPVNKDELRATLEKLIRKRRVREGEIRTIRQSAERKRCTLFGTLLTDAQRREPLSACPEFEAVGDAARLCLVKTDCTGTAIAAELYHLLQDKTTQILKTHHADLAVYFERDVTCFLLASESERDGAVREQLAPILFDLQKITEVFPQLRFTLFFGGRLRQPLCDEYRLLLRQLPLRRKEGAPRILAAETVPERSIPAGVFDCWNRDCEKMLDSLDPAVADSLLLPFVRTAAELPEPEAETALLTAGRRLAVKAEERQPERQFWFERTFVPALQLAGTAAELYDRFCAEIKKLIAEMGAKREQDTVRPVRLADAYMQRHYMDYDISLERVAETVSLTPAYFSMLYKKETGTGFLEALTAVRIKMAKLMLQDSSETVAKIAAAVGYTDIKYFSRIFKKTTGITPNEFRQFYR
ncbi:response regulator transcription factor [Treponema brennaborense]|uniref:Two component transcriptional regulator, AraC family n=1 Tax=Treponema brennaborense (strain DSM 12168 / CIP 105900 / DD5/3) TaxID=906968 RepID=F4LLJ2_TREBD|nr:helix-turn-helix domain-containing protein [Treponema brennaborense]AEE16656.1 two component transcriptional regulator, AraC family [Treponema brennaborense DSM 12168]